jgi:hypothetical protein
MHDPANAEAVAEARVLAGSRRRREATVAVVHDLEGLETSPGSGDSLRSLSRMRWRSTLVRSAFGS